MALSRMLSSVMLGAGLVLVFAGLSAAFGFTLAGMLASLGAIAMLLYAGGVWFGRLPSPRPAGAGTVILFDRDLTIAAGPGTGDSLLAQFPTELRPEIETRCRAALRGESARFVCGSGGSWTIFETAPVPGAEGAVRYGALVTSTGEPAAGQSARAITSAAKAGRTPPLPSPP